MWVRGLKPKRPYERHGKQHVAPYVGAWIETTITEDELLNEIRRTLCGCVD